MTNPFKKQGPIYVHLHTTGTYLAVGMSTVAQRVTYSKKERKEQR
jgi:hypothetical protein